MDKWNLIIDVENCTNCNMCVLACQDEHVDNEFPNYAAPMPKHGARWIEIMRKERGQAPMIDVAYMPVMCNHCDNAPCIKEAKDGAITKREDGIVIIDPVKSKGQKHLVDSCPYDRIWWNEELEIPQTWIFDAHLLDEGWKQPRASSVCATGSIVAKKISDEEMEKLAQDEKLEVLEPKKGTKPRVYYKNLYRYNSCFIGGSVFANQDNIIDCIQDADVTLKRNTEVIAEIKTDIFGDFKFDKLAEGSGDYQIEINADGFKKKTINIVLDESVTLEDIQLSK
ncbi:MAG: oxidoreductase [Rhodospirillaceae bacterium]|mgnify:FL=1|nr:oxidoreductase [Rhodospirillaceae bacterium]OUT80733.1 MAG: oxidoreductase [Rhodospirillaceae bacterium TMED23]|tara:strand:- start:227 stop:1072 length:846 start_codon:yes stop_codon:yes gene_type:complete